jgi:Spy/CpxP family protein refolding chaperone
MKKWIIAIGLMVTMLFGVNDVFAQSPGHGAGHGSMEHQGRGYGPGHGALHHQEAMSPIKDLSLTPEQKATFRELRRKFKIENAQLIGSLVAKRIELQALWTDPKADSNAIMQKENELTGLQNQMREKIVQSRLEARKSLTPEQIARFGKRWGMGHGFGRGGMMGRRGMMGRDGMKGHEGMMGEGGMGCCGGKKGSGHGMGMMGHGTGGMGGMGMCP